MGCKTKWNTKGKEKKGEEKRERKEKRERDRLRERERFFKLCNFHFSAQTEKLYKMEYKRDYDVYYTRHTYKLK